MQLVGGAGMHPSSSKAYKGELCLFIATVFHLIRANKAWMAMAVCLFHKGGSVMNYDRTLDVKIDTVHRWIDLPYDLGVWLAAHLHRIGALFDSLTPEEMWESDKPLKYKDNGQLQLPLFRASVQSGANLLDDPPQVVKV